MFLLQAPAGCIEILSFYSSALIQKSHLFERSEFEIFGIAISRNVNA